jgi:nitrate reductase gamma subunit
LRFDFVALDSVSAQPIDKPIRHHWNLITFLAFRLVTLDEPKMSDQQLFQQVLRHFAMGSSIGLIFSAALFALNARREIVDIVLNSSAPTTTLIILLFGISSCFGFGAAITGFVFIVMDEDSRKKP